MGEGDIANIKVLSLVPYQFKTLFVCVCVFAYACVWLCLYVCVCMHV